jgi:predicted acyltransferase
MRRPYLDVLRGVAVLLMVEAHVVDAWTRDADRLSRPFGYALILGGLAAPMFLFYAGVAVAMSAGSKARAWDDVRRASIAVQRRGWQIFGLAFLFRLQAFVLSPGARAWGILKVDILNIMGPAIATAALVWGWFGSTRAKTAAFASIAAAIALLTPPVRGATWLTRVPDVLEAYVRPVPDLANFTAFPWVAFVFAGACLGVILDAAQTPEDERRVNLWLACAAAVFSAAGFALARRPPIYANSNFWTSSPTYFAIRIGVITAATAAAYAVQQWRGPSCGHALQVFGRASLFVYWIHVEMVYGLLASAIRHQLAFPVTVVAYATFTFMLYVIVRIKNDIVAGRRAGRTRPAPPSYAGAGLGRSLGRG